MLGFSGGHTCCAKPCIQFPPFNINICLTLNYLTQATIQQGCNIALPEDDCNLYFPPGATYSTDGRKCKTINWSRAVPFGSYIRIALCAVEGCVSTCTPQPNFSVGPANALNKFTINGIDFRQEFVDVAAPGSNAAGLGGQTGCYIKAACLGQPKAFVTGDTCCQWYQDEGQSGDSYTVSWYTGAASLSDLPIGTELILGPIGSI
jgi:hypothetical protein